MSQRTLIWLLTLVAMIPVGAVPVAAQQAQNDQLGRVAKVRIQPTYPDLARKLNVVGVVKIEVTVAANGTVKNARVVGGHPLLANAALEAAWKWRFEPAASDSKGIIQFKFEPQ